MRTAIRNRYTLIRYYYSQFWKINEEGGSFFKPLFFDFGDDPEAYKVIEKNMLLGDHLKASVETTNLTKSDGVDFYFPTGTWCQIIPYMVSNFRECINNTMNNGTNVTLRSHMEDYYVHLREGSILPIQNATEHKTQRTHDQLQQMTDMIILPKNVTYNEPAANGVVYFDDGVSYEKKIRKTEMVYTVANSSEVQINFKQSGGYLNYTLN